MNDCIGKLGIAWHCALICLWVCSTQPALAQNTSAAPPIAGYTHASWTQLQRSIAECASLVDSKTNTAPVLYLPQELPEPSEVHLLWSACGVHVEKLPRRIDRAGNADVQVSADYKGNVIGLSWTNGVYLKLQQFLAVPAAGVQAPDTLDTLDALGVSR